MFRSNDWSNCSNCGNPRVQKVQNTFVNSGNGQIIQQNHVNVGRRIISGPGTVRSVSFVPVMTDGVRVNTNSIPSADQIPLFPYAVNRGMPFGVPYF